MPSQALKKIGSPLNLMVISFVISGWAVLAWIGQIIWTDLAFWGKDLPTILFGSRIGENISLGIGMTIFHYLLIGVLLIVASLLIKLVTKTS